MSRKVIIKYFMKKMSHRCWNINLKKKNSLNVGKQNKIDLGFRVN